MDYGSWTRENLRAPYYQPSFSSAADNLRAPYYQPSSSSAAATSNGYFTDQAVRAGGGGGGVGGRFEPQPPMDLQNERIRMEIHARDGTQSRILEENIRRDLEFDHVMAARRHEAERFYVPQPQPHHEPRLGERIWPAPLPRYPEAVMYDRFPAPREARLVERYELERVPRYPQAGAIDRFQPPTHDPRPVFRKKQPLARPLEMRASGSKLSGTKRKAVATAGVSEYSRPEKWRCKVCKVKASSEKGLKEHYQGKKHKAALEESRGGDQELTGKKPLGDKEVTDKKTLGDKELTKKKPLASSKPVQRKVEPVNETEKSTTQQKQKQNQSVDTSEGKPLFWCETCKLKCNSQTMLESHLNGKRHKAALDELAGCGIGSAKTGETPTKPDSEKMEVPLKLDSIKDGKIDVLPKLYPQKDEKNGEDEKMEAPAELEAEKTKAPSEMEVEKADKKTLGDKELTGKKPLASSKPVQQKVEPVNKTKKNTTQQKQKQKQSVDTSEGKPLFWCETCKLKCNSQTMLESHLNGKRHKAALNELAGGGIGSAKTADTPTKPESEKMEVPLELESIKDEKTDVPSKLYPQKDEKNEEDLKMDAPAGLEAEKTEAPSEMEAEMAENIEAPSEMEVENFKAPSEMVAEKAEKTDAPATIEAEGDGKPAAAAVETEVPAKLEPEKSAKPAAGKAIRRPTRKRAKKTAVGAVSVKKSAAAEEA